MNLRILITAILAISFTSLSWAECPQEGGSTTSYLSASIGKTVTLKLPVNVLERHKHSPERLVNAGQLQAGDVVTVSQGTEGLDDQPVLYLKILSSNLNRRWVIIPLRSCD